LELQTVFVPSHENIADALSHGDIRTFLDGFPTASTHADTPIPPHLEDKIVSW